MRKTFLFWLLAIIITLVGVYYQVITGPTYPISGKISIANNKFPFKLERSHSSSTNYNVELKVKNKNVEGMLVWKRYKTNDEWNKIEMEYNNGILSAELPKQPPAGKLQYQIFLKVNGQEISIPNGKPVIIRFKGDVPLIILIPHILAMFGAMLLSTRTGLEFFNKEARLKKHTYWTLGFLIMGGMILGPLTQYYAFGALWTGIPFGTDLTDNKTLIALIGWIIATVAIFKSKKPKVWVLAASILLLLVYSIPHSLFGSELDYNKAKNQNNNYKTVSTHYYQKTLLEKTL